MATTALRPKQAQELEGPAHAAKEIPDAAGKAKGMLSVSSKLFHLPTKNDNRKHKITQIWCVWNMLDSTWFGGGVKQVKRHHF